MAKDSGIIILFNNNADAEGGGAEPNKYYDR